MSYEPALEKAWDEISNLTRDKRFSVKFMADEYDIDLESKKVFSASCNVPSKEHINIIVIHYLRQRLRLKDLPKPTGRWIDFRELEGGKGYYPAFKKRTIGVILRKYGQQPDALLEAASRFNAHKAHVGDMGVVIDAFEDVPILITIYKADEEFGPDANILFDENINQIFCTEDIVVLTEIIAHFL